MPSKVLDIRVMWDEEACRISRDQPDYKRCEFLLVSSSVSCQFRLDDRVSPVKQIANLVAILEAPCSSIITGWHATLLREQSLVLQ